MTDPIRTGGAKAGTSPSGRGHSRHSSNSTNGDQSSTSDELFLAHPRSEPITRRPSNAQVWVPVQPLLTSESTPASPTDLHIKTYQGASAALYSPATTALSSPGGQRQLFSQSPFLHPSHRQPVKETHLLDVEFDPISGRKSINSYEIINEIGRGVHGKVKLGRNLLGDHEFVAIKIVERTSRPRLGKVGQKKGSQEEKVKREIAILKKCRHPNVVRLIEVIDDPSSKKVYLVLEFVELSEVKWRRQGDESIAQREALRLEKLRALALGTADAREEEQRKERQLRRRIAKQNEAARKARDERKRHQEHAAASEHMWSLEFGGETEESLSDDDVAVGSFTDDSHDDETPTAIKESSDVNPFIQDISDNSRNYSLSTIATNTSDSYDPDLMYVPSLTVQQARQVFRDTVLGLEYLHYQGIIHRDIKPANLLWNRDHRVKISDFGVSYLGQGVDEEGNVGLDQTDIELAKTVGTPAFFAPELCYSDITKPRPQITEAIDVWALGVTLYCLIFARCPFMASGEYELYNIIETQELFIPNTRLRPDVDSPSGSRPSTRRSVSHRKSLNLKLTDVPEDEPSNTHEPISADLKDLLRKLLTKDPAKRITLSEAKRHPWVLQDLDDAIGWIEESDPRRARPVEISREDVDHAVAPATVLGRVKNSLRKAVGGIATAVGLRRRAHSAVTIPTTVPIGAIPIEPRVGGMDGADDIADFVRDRETDAQKALKREKNLAPPHQHQGHQHPHNQHQHPHQHQYQHQHQHPHPHSHPHPHQYQHQHHSPLRRATSVTVANINKEYKTSLVTGLLPANGGSKAPPPTPIAETPVAQYENAEAHHSRRGHQNSAFSSRIAIGRLLRASKSRDMHRDFRATETRATETSSEPGDTDIVWKQDKEKRAEGKDKHFGSVRGWSGVIRRGSRQSCDSIMRLAAGFSDNKSSRSASPMPSMPSSPAEDPKPVFPPTPSRKSPFFPVSDTDDSKHSRDVSPISVKSTDDALANCPPSPEDATYLDVLANRSNKEGVFSGDDSSFSNTTTKVTPHSLKWEGSFPPRTYAVDMDQQVSPGTSVKSPSLSPRTRSPRPRHQHTRSFHFSTPSGGIPERSALTSSSSEEHFGTSSLSNSTSFPSVLSASSSLSTDDHWPHGSPPPKTRLNSADRLSTLPTCFPSKPAYQEIQTRTKLSSSRSGSAPPMEFLNTIEDVHDHPTDDFSADGAVADIEDCDDDDEEDEGFFIDFKKKEVRSNSLAASSRPQLTQLNKEQLANRRKSYVP
ncbi:hypothetical protein TWF102_011333 [Orbilia oligospora]|uniref:non-specific serine/threonine protein kinase n=1 Tax=Orbilia oligospora TaxID=2813651 RepID=A0A7C8JDW6_ORBOL|nr:hypothetical protein TWF102_011333 [Orbilia oligospora]KAF3126408.1 hypothetical protein TWF594_001117 [Orbilia oligospora]